MLSRRGNPTFLLAFLITVKSISIMVKYFVYDVVIFPIVSFQA